MTSRRNLFRLSLIAPFGFLRHTKPVEAAMPSPTGTITINPRELWLRKILYQWVWNIERYEQQQAKNYAKGYSLKERAFLNEEYFHSLALYYSPPIIVYLSDILSLDADGIKELFLAPWPVNSGGSRSHLEGIARSLEINEADGRLHLHLNPARFDHYTCLLYTSPSPR